MLLRVGYLVVFDSPNHGGVDGTDCDEVWIVTVESAILVIAPPYLGTLYSSLLRRHIFCLPATYYNLVTSLRNPWVRENGTFSGALFFDATVMLCSCRVIPLRVVASILLLNELWEVWERVPRSW
jgi:hypothetical protein